MIRQPISMHSATSKPSFDGIWIPMVTPFCEGVVDLVAAQRLATHLVDQGIHGLVVCGTTGEAALLEEDEQLSLLKAVLAAVGLRCPVFMGLSGSDTRAMTQKVTRFDQAGAAGFLISPPSYIRPSQQGVLMHFQALAAATERPIILYDIPARTGVDLTLATVLKLAADPQFVAIKKCGGHWSQMAELINQTSLKVLSGDDDSLFATLCLGGHGAISAAAHIRPDLFVQVFQLVQARQIDQARVVFNALLPLIKLLFSEPNPSPVKAALALQGFIQEELRLPMLPMTTTGKDQLRVVLEQVMNLPSWSCNHSLRISEADFVRE